MNEFEDQEELEKLEKEEKPVKSLIRRILRIAGAVFVIMIFAVFFWRICSASHPPKEVDGLSANETLATAYKNAYKNDPDFAFFAYTQKNEIYTRDVGNKETGDNGNYGYFAVPSAIIIEDAKQIQVLFRYNKSTLEYLPKDYPENCTEVPDDDEDVYDVTLVRVIDLTPEDDTDNEVQSALSEERIFAGKDVFAKSGRHVFKKLVFDGIEITDDTLAIYVDVYYKEAKDYSKDAYGVIKIYEKGGYKHPYKLSKSEKNALENYQN